MQMASSKKLPSNVKIKNENYIYRKRVYGMKKQHGVTLIELVITVAILGIILAVAWPAFERQSAKGRRSDAAIALTNARQALIAFRSDNGSYPADTATALGALRSYLVTAPNAPSIDCKDARGYQIPAGGGVISCQNYYNITVTAADANSFTLSAAPVVTTGDNCASLTLDHLGTRGRTGSDPVDRCWAQ
jgi:type IV pilus assembly protein PilE